MNFSIDFQTRKSYLYAHVTGTDSVDVSLAYCRQIAEEGLRLNLSEILIDEDLEGQLTDTEMYEVTSQLGDIGFAQFEKIAYIDRHADHGGVRWARQNTRDSCHGDGGRRRRDAPSHRGCQRRYSARQR